ncbi:NADPH-dependent FMN reductase [Virgibacillus sediminis]|uniref:NADPH-dependent FMN reductase n=1 Tax=Virgibacillus sediminis TaxID=202260 RepID=A0ABV7A7X6_9BACI
MGFLSRLFGKTGKKQDAATTDNHPLRIAIVQGSVREGRNGTAVADWIYDFASTEKADNAKYEIVNLADFKLPMFGKELQNGEKDEADAAVKSWSEKMASFDGYIFITPEYNHTAGGALKNALDYLKPEVANKAAAFVGYGSLGGARAHENMRLVLGELQMADVRTAVTFSLMTDFENMSEFNPAPYHRANAGEMLDQLIAWSEGFRSLRAS